MVIWISKRHCGQGTFTWKCAKKIKKIYRLQIFAYRLKIALWIAWWPSFFKIISRFNVAHFFMRKIAVF